MQLANSNPPYGVDSLPALSKCHNLRFLDLDLVADPISITSLENAVRNLKKLATLRLPHHSLDCPSTTAETNPTSTSVNWPASLREIQISGAFSESDLSAVSWPRNLTTLTLNGCRDLSVGTLGKLLSRPHLRTSLKHLTITNLNERLTPVSINTIPFALHRLEFLSAPGDLVEDTFFWYPLFLYS